MRSKRSFAAILCAVTFLTGCSGASETSGSMSSEQSSSVSVPNYSEESSSDATESSTASSAQSSSSSSIVSVPPKKKTIPKAKLDQNGITVNEYDGYMTVPFTTDIPFDSNKQYFLRVYFAETSLLDGEVMYEEIFDTSSSSIDLTLYKGNNYYNIQFYTNNEEGELSNRVYKQFTAPPPIEHKNFEFYTMTAAYYGDAFESLLGYPDYDEVDRLLAQGITPEYISVDIYYRCLLCGTETYCTTAEYSYSEGEGKLVPYHCDNVWCSNHTTSRAFLISRII